MTKYIELKENSEYDRVVNEYNNHYGHNLNNNIHRSFDIPSDKITHLNVVNEGSFLKKR